MKEIIYLDNELVNSYLAQFERGLVNKATTSAGSSETGREDISNTASAAGGIKIPGLADLSSEGATTISSGSTFSQSNLESLEVAFHDYALDKLLEYIKIDENHKEGDFILTHDKMTLYNFTRLENLMQQDIVLAFDEDFQYNEEIYNQINVIKQSSEYKTNKKF